MGYESSILKLHCDSLPTEMLAGWDTEAPSQQLIWRRSPYIDKVSLLLTLSEQKYSLADIGG